jgi:uncharacterized membrane protein
MEEKREKQAQKHLQEKENKKQQEAPHHLPREIEDLIKSLPKDKREEAVSVIASLSVRKASTFSGPLPPPEVLGDYNEILQDGAERIMKMAEHQSGHRIEQEKHAIKEELKQSGRGQIFGFILAIIGMAIAFGLALLDHDTVAGIFGTTTIVGLVTIFVIGKKKQQDKESD